MDFFNYIAGIASMFSLIISIIALWKVYNIQNLLIDKRKHRIKQFVIAKKLSGSSVMQVGGDKDGTSNKQS
jgi:hypothetical protein